jgi:hypothetical protein
MASHTLTPLSPPFGVEVGHRPERRDGRYLFPDIRALFEEHSALLFRGQDDDREAFPSWPTCSARWRIAPRRPQTGREDEDPQVSNVLRTARRG